ncbi:hypothetical protein [Effusibacillus consociatus]|uniref:Resolvase/invertase-type recombinase catalytic domain-containing protein n=1 Tax=Effusibacillus consociatus TaxID=1117041 RepID=A0ABV9Q2A1_9BACL
MHIASQYLASGVQEKGKRTEKNILGDFQTAGYKVAFLHWPI